jgi:hypothetical protein
MKSRLILLLTVMGLVFTPLAWGQYQYSQVFDNEGVAAQYETLTPVASTKFTTSKSCVAASDGGKVCAKAALISVETGAVRFTLEGTVPVVTATGGGVGHLLAVGDSYVVRGFENVQKFLCIQAVTATGGIVRVTYFY